MKKSLLISLAYLLISCSSQNVDGDESALNSIDLCPLLKANLPTIWQKVVPEIEKQLGKSILFIDTEAPKYTDEMTKWLVNPSFAFMVGNIPGVGSAGKAVLNFLGNPHVNGRIDAFEISRLNNIETLTGGGLRHVDFGDDCKKITSDAFIVKPDIDVFTYVDHGYGPFRSFFTLRPNVPVKLVLTPFLTYDGVSRIGLNIDLEIVPSLPGGSLKEALAEIGKSIGKAFNLNDPSTIINSIDSTKRIMNDLKRRKFTFRKALYHTGEHKHPGDGNSRTYCYVDTPKEWWDFTSVAKAGQDLAAKLACDALMSAVINSDAINIAGFFIMLSDGVQSKLESFLRYRVFLDNQEIQKR